MYRCSNNTTVQRNIFLTKATYLILLCEALLLCTSCSTVTVKGTNGEAITRNIDEFKNYAEDVFRRQNRTSSDITLLLMDIDPADTKQYQLLQTADENIINACGPLNSLAIKMVEEKNVDLTLQLSLLDTISHCEMTTQNVEETINAIRAREF